MTTFFEDTIISHRSQFTWPARSPDLNPLRHCQGRNTQERTGLIEELRQAEVESLRSSGARALEKVFDNFVSRCIKCKLSLYWYLQYELSYKQFKVFKKYLTTL